MPSETMRMWEEPTIILEAAKSAINLANKMHEFAFSLDALARFVKNAIAQAEPKRPDEGDWQPM